MILKCEQCGYKGEPIMYQNGPHITAYCISCGKYIKHISKNELDRLDKGVIELNSRLEEPNGPECVVIGYDGEVIK